MIPYINRGISQIDHVFKVKSCISVLVYPLKVFRIDASPGGCGEHFHPAAPWRRTRVHCAAGDVLICLAGVERVAGPGQWLCAGYQCAYLRQRENQYLVCPPRAARLLPPHMQRLIGYGKPGHVLNKLYCGGGPVEPPCVPLLCK